MKTSFFLVLFSLFVYSLNAQQAQKHPSPYKTSWKDGAISAAGIGLSYWGLTLMKDKEAVSKAEIRQIDADLEAARAEIPFFDRWAAGYHNEGAERISDFPFYGSFGLPLLFLADERTRANAPQIGLLYLETMAITGALFTQVNGRVSRKRPSVYSQVAGPEIRMDDKSQNSFYGGHVAATAAATFFTAKIFNDYFPDSPVRPYIWAGAAAIPAAVGVLRVRAGKHFLSDNVLGYALGAATGILVPHLHKRSSAVRISSGQGVYGSHMLRLQYRF